MQETRNIYLLLLRSLLLDGEGERRLLVRRSGEWRREVLRRGGERERLRESRTSRLGDLDREREGVRERSRLSTCSSTFTGLSNVSYI